MGSGTKAGEQPTDRDVSTALDQVFHDRDKAPASEIREAVGRAEVAPDMTTYFDHLPDREFSRSEVADEVNRMIRERGREQDVGLIH